MKPIEPGRGPEDYSDDELRIQNEIEKLKLSAFRGAKFFGSEDLSPAVENEWLKQIAAFEEQFDNTEYIKLVDKLGRPDFPPVDELSDEQVGHKLEEVRTLMADHNVYLDVLTDISAAEEYRFITEELFEEKVDDIRIEGFQQCFIYEEFHPDAKLDIEDNISHFLFELFSEDFRDHISMHFSDRVITTAGKFIGKEEAAKRILSFAESFNNFKQDKEPWDLEIEVDEDEQTARARFKIKYSGRLADQSKNFEGTADTLWSRDEMGFWRMRKVSLPGFQL